MARSVVRRRRNRKRDVSKLLPQIIEWLDTLPSRAFTVSEFNNALKHSGVSVFSFLHLKHYLKDMYDDLLTNTAMLSSGRVANRALRRTRLGLRQLAMSVHMLYAERRCPIIDRISNFTTTCLSKRDKRKLVKNGYLTVEDTRIKPAPLHCEYLKYRHPVLLWADQFDKHKFIDGLPEERHTIVCAAIKSESFPPTPSWTHTVLPALLYIRGKREMQLAASPSRELLVNYSHTFLQKLVDADWVVMRPFCLRETYNIKRVNHWFPLIILPRKNACKRDELMQALNDMHPVLPPKDKYTVCDMDIFFKLSVVRFAHPSRTGFVCFLGGWHLYKQMLIEVSTLLWPWLCGCMFRMGHTAAKPKGGMKRMEGALLHAMRAFQAFENDPDRIVLGKYKLIEKRLRVWLLKVGATVLAYGDWVRKMGRSESETVENVIKHYDLAHTVLLAAITCHAAIAEKSILIHMLFVRSFHSGHRHAM